MPRPVKIRNVGFIPRINYFAPNGIHPKTSEECIMLKYDELEAMRLKDIENLNQEECAQIMNVSRQTFQLIIDEARRKVASSLIEGKSLKITGGHYVLGNCMHKCQHCGRIYSEGDHLTSCPNENCEFRKNCCQKQK